MYTKQHRHNNHGKGLYSVVIDDVEGGGRRGGGRGFSLMGGLHVLGEIADSACNGAAACPEANTARHPGCAWDAPVRKVHIPALRVLILGLLPRCRLWPLPE